MTRLRRIAAAAAGALLLSDAAPFGAPEIYSKKTDELLFLCQNGGADCMSFVNDVLKTLNAAVAIRAVGTYKGCAPAPLDSDQVDEVVLWILSRAPLSTGFAAQDIGQAAQDIWPCK